MRSTALGLGYLTFASAAALPHNRRQVPTHDVAPGTFQSPANSVKAKFRYWFPDASINATLFAEDIAALGQRGAGGTEFLNYYMYGGNEGAAPTDWNIYGYGTETYRELLKAGLQAHIDNGLVFDYAMGPQSGQGVPAEPDNPGLSWELVHFNITVNNTFTGQLPGWGQGDLMAASTFAVLNSALLDAEDAGSEYGSGPYYQLTISNSSLTQVTDLVGSNGTITVTVPQVEGNEYYLLYASYARRSYQRACIASSQNPQNILQNGSFAVDHFSSTGAKVTTDFLEQYIMIDGIKELIEEIGGYIWEDSVEIESSVYWTPDLPKIFEERHGYSLLPFLPLLQGDEGDQAQANGTTIVTDTVDAGRAFVADWRETMTYLLGTYYDHLVEWSQSYLNLTFSAQVGYNLPVDMLATVPHVNVPETETLSFMNSIDGFLQYSGPAGLSGKSIVSIELGAELETPYSQTWTSLLQEAKQGFAGGVNKVVIHGATYSHAYANTTWPGFTSFEFLFSGHHSRHQPAWDVGYSEAIQYLGRTQWVLQTGTSKLDIAFWDKQTAQNAFPAPLYVPDDLTMNGYAYEYLSPENLDLPDAYVEDNILAPTRQAFKAVILRGNDTLTPNGVEHLVQYAKAGLPIIISGGIPTTYATSNETAISSAERALESIVNLENVYQIPYEELAAELATIGIQPRAKVQSDGLWHTRWREVSNGDNYVFIYNEGNSSSRSISFNSSGTPYLLDAWTGEESPVLEYTEKDGLITIPLTLQSTQTAIVRFSQENSKRAVHATSSSDTVLGYEVSPSGTGILAKVGTANTISSISLSNNTTVRVDTSSISAQWSLTNWTLTVEHWDAPADLYNLQVDANKTNITLSVAGPSLPAWSDLGLTNVSGIGYYSVDFEWAVSSNCTGAFVSIPPASHGLVGYLNSKALPALDITNPIVDITPYLVQGTNRLLLKASTTLMNSLIPYWDRLLTAGIGPAIPLSALETAGLGSTVNGLVGEVSVIPYSRVEIV